MIKTGQDVGSRSAGRWKRKEFGASGGGGGGGREIGGQVTQVGAAGTERAGSARMREGNREIGKGVRD